MAPSENSIALQGSLDVTTVSTMHSQWVDCLSADESIRIDMADVTNIDASVIQLILASQKHAAENGKSFGMDHLSAPVERSLESSGALKLLQQFREEL